MTIGYAYLLFLVLGIFLFCYFVATWVWIKVDKSNTEINNESNKDKRRDFLYLASISIGGLGAASFMWPFIKSMNPAEDTLALGTIEVDLSAIEVGQSITVKWRGKPVFIRRRTKEEIVEAQEVNVSMLRDPVIDSDRVQKDEWLVLEGVCTHLGCVPLADKGEYKGWFCPCHGSHYDTSGRIRKGPAPTNMEIPKYEFVNNNTIKIG